MTSLEAMLKKELAAKVTPAARQFAEKLAAQPGALAVIYYGSTLRTGDLSGLLDFYVLTEQPHRTGFRGALERRLWPEVSYREAETVAGTLRAKASTMPLSVFRRAAEGRPLDTTIWARFVQPAGLVWTRDVHARDEVVSAIAAAARTAGSYAAVLGPERGVALEYWRALFRQTYQAEFRVETASRADEILRVAPARWSALLPLAWTAQGFVFERNGDDLRPILNEEFRRTMLARWRARRRSGKPLNLARLAKAAFTFDGAARYAAWKIERHTGMHVELTPFRERHPILASPVVLWQLSRWKRKP